MCHDRLGDGIEFCSEGKTRIGEIKSSNIAHRGKSRTSESSASSILKFLMQWMIKQRQNRKARSVVVIETISLDESQRVASVKALNMPDESLPFLISTHDSRNFWHLAKTKKSRSS